MKPTPAFHDNTAHMVLEGTFPLNAAANVVWPYLERFSEWQDYSLNVPVSGESGQVGQVIRLQKAGADGFAYYAKTVLREDGKRIIWRTYPDDEDGEIFRGYVEFSITGNGPAKSIFGWRLIYEYVVETRDPQEISTLVDEHRRGAETLLDQVLPRLARLVEK